MSDRALAASSSSPDPVVAGLVTTVLGRLSVRGAAGAALGDIESRFHVKALFALLAATPGGLERDALVAALWPRLPGAAGRNRLHHTVHLLKVALAALSWPAEWVRSEAGRIDLHEAVCSDARCVAAAARRAEAGTLDDAALHEALRHCEAHWMPDLALGDAGEDCRHRIWQDQLQLLREGARRLAAAGDAVAQRELLARVLTLQPTDEWACRALMTLELAAGRPNAAWVVYEALTCVLAERLGLRVSAETAAVAALVRERLSAQTRPAPAAAEPTDALPAQGVLLGRERESAWLVQACRQVGAVVSLCGIGGVGKTALAAVAARSLVGDFDSVHWVALGEGAQRGCAAAVAQALGLDAAPLDAGEPAPDPALDAVLATLRSRRLLLVLDDADLAIGHLELLLALQQAASERALLASVLCVTRLPLPGSGGSVLALQGLALPHDSADAAQKARAASVALFLLRCPAGPNGGAADGTDGPALADVVALLRRLDGLPLAIELAAARTMDMTPREILERVEDSLSVLSVPSVISAEADAPGQRPRSMQAALQRSVQALPSAARAVFAQLAVFDNPFTPTDLAALLAELQLPADVAAALDALLASGLVQTTADAGLRVPHLPRLLAQTLAQAAGQLAPWRAAWWRVLHRRLAALDLGYESPRFEDGLRQVGVLHDSALSAIQHAQDIDRAGAVQMLLPLGTYWLLHGHFDRIETRLPQALVWAEQLAMAAEALQLRLLLAAALPSQFKHAQALEHALAAETLARQLGDLPSTVHAVCRQADALCWQGHGDLARQQVHALGAEFGLLPGRPGYWRWRLHPFGDGLCASPAHPPLAQGAAQQALRDLHGGSAMWLEFLAASCSEGATSPDPAAALAAADELVQRAEGLDATMLATRALWQRLWCELALDRLDDCAASARRLHTMRHYADEQRQALTAALLSTELGWRRGQLEHAAQALADAHASSVGLAVNPFAIDLALHAAMLHALRGDADAAWPAWRAVALAAAELSVPHLFSASEVAVVLHGVAGRAAAVGSLGAVLRRLDTFNEATPLVQRFRAHWFTAIAVAAMPSTQGQALALLRSLLRGAAQSA